MPTDSGTAVRELKIGPYAGGINTYSDQSAIADDEMVDCMNFDIDLDGSLKSRPPWQLLTGFNTPTAAGATPPNCFQLLLYSGTYGALRFIIIQSNHTGAGAAYIYYVDGPSAGTLALIAAGNYSTAVRYADDIYMTPDVDLTSPGTSLGTGQKYALATGVVTAIANMPRGYSSRVYKERLWICGRRGIVNNSRLFFSKLADFSTWTGADSSFFDVNPGDGDALQDLIVYQDNLVLFKDSATYVLSYDSGPASAVLQAINMDIGVNGPRCAVAYENSLFLLKYNQVYEMVNYDFIRVSVKVPFVYDATVPAGVTGQDWKYPINLSVIGDRLMIGFYNRKYIYHLRLKAWTRWQSNDTNIQYVGQAILLDNTNVLSRLGFNTYIATSALIKNVDANGPGVVGAWNAYFKIFYIEDRYSNASVENGNIVPNNPAIDISLSMTTKTYDIGLSHRFKRLMHWGVDTVTSRDVTGTLFPSSVAFQVTWAQLHAYQWHALNTWGYPLFSVPVVTQSQPFGAGVSRRYVRFPKSLRFRLIQFKVDMITAGNLNDGPARLYSITAFIGGKQLTPKAVN